MSSPPIPDASKIFGEIDNFDNIPSSPTFVTTDSIRQGEIASIGFCWLSVQHSQLPLRQPNTGLLTIMESGYMLRTPLIAKQIALVAIFNAFTLVSATQAQIPWTHDYNAAQSASTASGAVMLLHFYTDNCVPCKMLDARAFQDPALIDAVKRNVIPVKINAETNSDIAKQYGVTRWPTDIYIAADGTELFRTVSPQKATDYVAVLDRIAIRNRDHVVVAEAENNPAQQLAVHRDPPNKLAANSKGENYYATGKLSDKDTYANPANTYEVPANTYQIPANTYKPASPIAAALGSSAIQSTAPQADQPKSVAKASLASNRNLAPNNVDEKRSIPANPVTVTVNASAEPHESVVENLYCVAEPEKTESGWESRSLTDDQKSDDSTVGTAAVSEVSHPNPYAHVPAMTVSAPMPAPAPQLGQTEPLDHASQRLESEVRTATAPESGPAMKGYCPVTLDERGVWKQGDTRFAVRHRGRVYCLANRECQQKFLQAPDRYAPILSGFDLVHFLHTGELRDGLREYGCWFKGRVYLFANAENRDFFDDHVIEFAATAEALQKSSGAGSSEPSAPKTSPQEQLDSSQGRIATEPKLPTLAR